jgi:hypothetical protein
MSMKLKRFLLLPFLTGITLILNGQCCDHQRPDIYAPSGVPYQLSDSYTEQTGLKMLGYRFQFKRKQHLLHLHSSHSHMYDGLVDIQKHQLEGVYSLIPNLSVRGTLPYWIKDMDMDARAPNRQQEPVATQGIGDLNIGLITNLLVDSNLRIDAHVSLQAPSGSFKEQIRTTHGTEYLPYMMQLGTGSWTLNPTLQVYYQQRGWAVGMQSNAFWRMGSNDLNYRLGHQYQADIWFSYRLTNWLSTALTFTGQYLSGMKGQVLGVNSNTRPPAGYQLSGEVGLQFWIPLGITGEHRIQGGGVFTLNQSEARKKQKTKFTLIS